MTLNCVHRPSDHQYKWSPSTKCQQPFRRVDEWVEVQDTLMPLKADEPGWVNGIGFGRQGESTASKILRISPSCCQSILGLITKEEKKAKKRSITFMAHSDQNSSNQRTHELLLLVTEYINP
ncbi:uncharacterized protein LOC110835234 [Zootermopsis nevadensis]|uniref:uncharacterized protein LOC110835234 n=1 Tax=Zootermopsis nevadensis TaxID=136037 RepID=UPI000B8EACAC|nr:uncharacterized protein LOC110835234 [Zootermopsis nevadensis]